LIRNRRKIAAKLLCNCCKTATQSLRNRNIDVQSLRKRCVSATESLCYRFATRYAINAQSISLGDRCGNAALLLRNCFTIGFTIASQSMQNRYIIATHLLYNSCFAIASQSLQNGFAIALKPMRNHCPIASCGIAAESLSCRRAIAVLSPRYRCAVAALSPRYRCAITALSPRYRRAIATLSLRFRCAIAALSPRYRCAFAALSPRYVIAAL
jgi:hypothetical protein